jgi:hypothetical protein
VIVKKEGTEHKVYTQQNQDEKETTISFDLYQITQLHAKEEQKKPPRPGGKKPAASAFPYYFPAPV